MHQKALDVLEVGDAELEEAVGQHVPVGGLVTVTDLHAAGGTLGAATHAGVDTVGLSPGLLLVVFVGLSEFFVWIRSVVGFGSFDVLFLGLPMVFFVFEFVFEFVFCAPLPW